jgi:hypothetical protein
MHMAMMQGSQENTVTIPIPGIEHVSLVYHSSHSTINAQRIRMAAAIIAYWLTRRSVQVDPRHIRNALRRLSSPWLLGETELACLLFDNIQDPAMRGEALQSLLLQAIERLNPGTDVRPEYRRGYLIVWQLYVERRLPQDISHDLGLSGRQYQRCLSNALVSLSQVVADVL